MATTIICQFFIIGILIIIYTNVLTSGQCVTGIQHLRVGSPGEILTLTSPKYPSNYPSFADCKWVLTAPPGDYLIELRIQSLEIERTMSCIYDSLVINDGSRSSSPLLEKLCGVKYPDVIQSTGSNIYIHFYSDSSTEKSGFEIDYTSISKNSSDSVDIVHNETVDIGVKPTHPYRHTNSYDVVTAKESDNADDEDASSLSPLYTMLVASGAFVGLILCSYYCFKHCRGLTMRCKKIIEAWILLLIGICSFLISCCDCRDNWCDKEVRDVGDACGCKCSDTCLAIGAPDNDNDAEITEPVTLTVDRDVGVNVRHEDDPRGELSPLTPTAPPMERALNSERNRHHSNIEPPDYEPPPPPYEGVIESRIEQINSGQPVVVPSIRLHDLLAPPPSYEDVMDNNTGRSKYTHRS
uniref:Uncharacterized protein LOC102807740 n=1 Tax=Saccoglossus kowalevskii TaxID=10224 RepID=A0ABM0MN85_SACKO|nr:PREDICTED: uncharacterized protein LOC102807740 [Saccoglossus kowalevskii]